jgi:hypothetical protein
LILSIFWLLLVPFQIRIGLVRVLRMSSILYQRKHLLAALQDSFQLAFAMLALLLSAHKTLQLLAAASFVGTAVSILVSMSMWVCGHGLTNRGEQLGQDARERQLREQPVAGTEMVPPSSACTDDKLVSVRLDGDPPCQPRLQAPE